MCIGSCPENFTVSRHLLIGYTCSVSNCSDLEGSVQLVQEHGAPNKTQKLVTYLVLGLSQKRTRKAAVVSEQEGTESIRRRLVVDCHKERRTVEKVIEQGVVETQQDFDGET
jgi:hypothetical protein